MPKPLFQKSVLANTSNSKFLSSNFYKSQQKNSNALYNASQIATHCLGCYLLLDALAPLGVVLWRYSFAALFITISIIFFTAPHTLLSQSWTRIPTICLMIITITGLSNVIFQEIFYPIYFFGDLALTIFYVLIFFIFLSPLSKDERIRSFRVIFFYAILSAILSPLSALYTPLPSSYYYHIFRFDAPEFIVIIGILFAVPIQTPYFVRSLVLLPVLYLSFLSQWRSYFLISLTITFLGLWMLSSRGSGLRIIVLIVVPLVLITFSVNQFLVLSPERFNDLLQGTRYLEFLSPDGDASTKGRLLEAQDIIVITLNDSTLFQILLGHGHGATFEPINSFPEPNVTSETRVHNIHIFAFLLFYRYGLIAIILYIVFILYVINRCIFLSFRKSKEESNDLPIIFTLLALALVGKSLVLTISNDPLVPYIIANFLAVSKRESTQL